MAIRSTPLGSVTVSGDEAKALTRKLVYGRGTRAAMAAAKSGRQLVQSFAERGSVVFHLSRTDRECVAQTLKSLPPPTEALKRALDRRNKLLRAE